MSSVRSSAWESTDREPVRLYSLLPACHAFIGYVHTEANVFGNAHCDVVDWPWFGCLRLAKHKTKVVYRKRLSRYCLNVLKMLKIKYLYTLISFNYWTMSFETQSGIKQFKGRLIGVIDKVQWRSEPGAITEFTTLAVATTIVSETYPVLFFVRLPPVLKQHLQ